MASAADHEAVAKLAAVGVLECFPKAETEVSLLALCLALRVALAYCDWSAVERVIGERLGQGGLGTAERSCWLVAGYLASPSRHREEFCALEKNEDGLKWLAQFLSFGRVRSNLARRITGSDLVFFVATVGAADRKHGLTEVGYRSVESEIGRFAEDTSSAATETLKMLSEERDAEPWMPVIAHAREPQARKRREKEYEYCDIGEVIRTLDNGSPANPGDLAALVFDETVRDFQEDT